MQAERIKFLLEQLESEPNEPFNIYALAIEYKEKDPEKALNYFETLLNQFPDYLPTYYHAANLYFQFIQNSKADLTYLKGIELAEEKKNDKALRELKAAHQMFLDEIDE